MINIHKYSIRRFIHKIYHLFVYDNREIYICQENHTFQIKALQERIADLQNQIKGDKVVFNYLLDSIVGHKNEYIEELKYVVEHGYNNFPYNQIKVCDNYECGFDIEKQLPYAIHKGKKLYFPRNFSVNRARDIYKYLIDRECILGGGYTEKMPHQYQCDSFKIEEGDVLIDVGCAEALLSLDTIDIVTHAYLIEGDSMWIPALEATFEPYKNKVTIINKYVGSEDENSTIRLNSILYKCKDSSLFIKMDIEGAEYEVLKGSSDYLSNKSNIKIACCTYHKHNDFINISMILNSCGYEVNSTDGFMLFDLYDSPYTPYFRKGLVRAMKK